MKTKILSSLAFSHHQTTTTPKGTVFVLGITALLVAIPFYFFVFMPSRTVPTPSANTSVESREEQDIAKGQSLEVTPSHQWYTSALFSYPSEPLYAFPLAFKVERSGLGLSFPSKKIQTNTISAPYDEDLIVGIGTSLGAPSAVRRGDWSITLKQTDNRDNEFIYTLAQGAPFVTFTGSKKYEITPATPFKITKTDGAAFSGKKITTDVVVLEIKKKWYIITSQKPYVMQISNDSLTVQTTTALTVALLDDRTHAQEFRAIAGAQIEDTAATYEVRGAGLATNYQIKTNDITPFVGLFPHHQDHLMHDVEEVGSYDTLRGKLSLIKTSSFTTTLTAPELPLSFERVKTGEKEIVNALKKDISSVLKEDPSRKIYGRGVWLGRSATLIQLADTYKLEQEKQQLMSYTLPLLRQALNDIEYDAKQQSMISSQPEYGHEKLNDHHFHYGYLVRCAAVLTKYSKELPSEMKKKVQELVGDIMTIDRQSSRFPYQRTFNIYEGHSYADGYGDFADGMNQESTSEALNAWYGIWLWGTVTNQLELKKRASALFYTEKESAFQYWFNKNDIYSEPYNHALASIVWGGKVDFATWFSPDTNMKYGIQLLPFTPASVYLGELPDFNIYEKDISNNKGGTKYEWGDLYLMWKSFYDPSSALQEKIDMKKGETHTPPSVFLYFLNRGVEKSE
jgi:endoglucanase Acf2